MKRMIAYAAILAATAAAAAGCTRRTLDARPDGSPVRIILDWRDNTPTDATGFVFYNNDGSAPLYYGGNSNGFEGRLPAGTYSVAIFNTDAAGAKAEYGLGYSTDYFHAMERTRAVPQYIGVIDNVFGCGIEELVVPKSHIGVESTATPVNYVKKVDFTIDPRNVQNIDFLTVCLSGVVYSVRITSGEQADADATIVIDDTDYDAAAQRYKARVTVFGFSGTNETWVTVNYDDGNKEDTIPKDITQEIKDSGEAGIEINLDLQLESGEEIGMNVKVLPWDGSGTGSGIVD